MAIVKINNSRDGQASINYLRGKAHNGKEQQRNAMVSGINCPDDLDSASKMMKSVWDSQFTQKLNKVEMYQYIQSFSKEELNPQNPHDVSKCNQLGQELAQKIMGKTHHFCIVATQKDGRGGQLHNHILICNQDFTNGKAIRGNPKDFYYVSKLNDKVLENNGMKQPEVIRNGVDYKESMAEIKLRQKGKYVWKDDLRNRITDVANSSKSWQEFHQGMKGLGVNVRAFKKKCYDDEGNLTDTDENKRLKSISFSFEGEDNKEHHARSKKLGKDYEFDNLNHIFQQNAQIAKEKENQENDFMEMARDLAAEPVEFSVQPKTPPVQNKRKEKDDDFDMGF